MAPKGRWGRKEKDGSRVEAPAGPTAAPILQVRKKEVELNEKDCMSVLLENYYSIKECEHFMKVLTDEIDWKRQEVTLAQIPGDRKTVGEPRMTLFMSDADICYAYSGRDNAGVDWHPQIMEIKRKAEAAMEECGLPATTFNCVQLNRYNGPRHTLGLHKDNEPDLLKGAPIASVSFGAPRDFVIQHGTDSDEHHKVELSDGSFFVMGGAMQQKYLHGVPVGSSGLRFNLTFRVAIPRQGAAAVGRPLRPAVQQRPGDWVCPTCGDVVFASRAACRCGYAKHGVTQKSLDRDAVQAAAEAIEPGEVEERLPDVRTERRIDPHDGRTYTYEALQKHYAMDFSEKEVRDYWHDECKLAAASSKPGRA